MSLVNRMLLDLEERQSVLQGEPALAGLTSVDYCSEEDRRQRGMGRVAMLSAVVVLVGLVVMTLGRIVGGEEPAATSAGKSAQVPGMPVAAAKEKESARQATTGAPAEAASLASMSLRLDDTLYSLAQLSTQESTVAVDSVAVEVAPAPAERAITGIALVPDGQGTTLELALNAEARYLAYALENPSRVVIEIPGTALRGELPQADGTGGVQRIRAREERGKAILVMDLVAPAASVNAGMVRTDAGARLNVEVVPSVVPATVDAGTAPAPVPAAVSHPAPASVVESGFLERRPATRGDVFTDARTLCGSGRVAACIGKLTELLAGEPGHIEGRLLLASTLVENGDPRQGAATLDAGLALQPRAWQLAQLRAQLAINAGDAEHARVVLAAAAPPLAEQPEYHALLAAVQQRTGRHEQAIATYHGVLARHPERGVWWMGLGISLQALARDREAGFAYMRALEDTSLSSDLRRFIETRRGGLAGGDNA